MLSTLPWLGSPSDTSWPRLRQGVSDWTSRISQPKILYLVRLGSGCPWRTMLPKYPQRQKHPCDAQGNSCCWDRHCCGYACDGDWYRMRDGSRDGYGFPDDGYCQEDRKRIDLPVYLHVVSLRPNRVRMGRTLRANRGTFEACTINRCDMSCCHPRYQEFSENNPVYLGPTFSTLADQFINPPSPYPLRQGLKA